MKRLLLATVALSLLAAPAAFAQPQDYHHKRPQQTHVVKKKVVTKKFVTRQDWKRGHRLPHGQHYTVVKDYGRYHLRRPPRGQHWVRVDNQYLLVGITSGIIAALVNAQ
jgi:Ni/Co efflux regulator RcnB